MKIRDGKNNKESARRARTALLIVILILMALWAISPLATRIKQQRELAALSKERARVRQENKHLRAEIKKLRGDKDYWEALARRNLGYVKADEEAYVVIEGRREAASKPRKAARPRGFLDSLVSRVKNFSIFF